MADSRPLGRSRRIQGREPKVDPWESSPRHTPLRRLRPISFTLSREIQELERPLKHCRLDLLSIEIESDSPRDNQIDYLPSNFPFSLYQPLPPPSPKRLRVLPPPFSYFDPDSPTFGIVAPPLLMDGPTSSTMASRVSFTTEILSHDTTGTLIP